MAEFDPSVEYRAIPSLPAEFYRAGSDGSIWGCQRSGLRAGTVGNWHRLKDVTIGRGYRGVRLGVAGVHKTHYIHHLILAAFVGPRPPGMEACHGPGGKRDNRPENLRWDTPAENVRDKFRHGTQPMGSLHYRAKFTEEDIPAIRRRLECGESPTAVARGLGVNSSTIENIRDRRTWKHVP